MVETIAHHPVDIDSEV
ncbi:hypothetical protein [Escherichia coli]